MKKKTLMDIDVSMFAQPPLFIKERDPIATETERKKQKDAEEYSFEIGSIWVNKVKNSVWMLHSRRGDEYQWEPFNPFPPVDKEPSSSNG